jgi:hypothetical protein
LIEGAVGRFDDQTVVVGWEEETFCGWFGMNASLPPPSHGRPGLTRGGMRSRVVGKRSSMATEDQDVCSVPLETEDGEEVVICQQNAGPGNQVGGGEFKGGSYRKTPEQAAAEQDALERDAAVDR